MNRVTPRKAHVVDLASRSRRGRRQLVERLFERHAQALRLFMLARAVPKEESEELVQELFARLMVVDRLEEKMSGSPGRSRSYLLTIANNLIVDRLRKLRLRSAWLAARTESERERLDERSPERILAAEMELEAIKAVIMDMRLNWRVAFVLQRFRNMSYEEIALHMGVSKKSVENFIVRAMRRIDRERRKMEAAGEWPC